MESGDKLVKVIRDEVGLVVQGAVDQHLGILPEKAHESDLLSIPKRAQVGWGSVLEPVADYASLLGHFKHAV
jgi:hypothetical protein